MRPTEILMQEHRLIERVLAALETQAKSILAGGLFDTERSKETIRFIREFADHYHHAKEEDQLFPAMERCGFSREAGPIAVMLAEHDDGRSHVKRMAGAVEDPDREAAGEDYAKAARNFVDLLRNHIMKEDEILYPMADQGLSEADQADLLVRFRQVEEEQFGPGKVAELKSLAEHLCSP